MKNTLLFWLLAACIPAFAQHRFEKVDLKEVKKATIDTSLPTYFTKLGNRYLMFDTTLTLSDYRLIYYGQYQLKAYNPKANQRKAELQNLLDTKQYALALKICDTLLSECPVSLVANYMKAGALYGLNNSDPKALKYRYRYRMLRNAILSSGNGYRCADAFLVLYDDDMYDILFHYFEATGAPLLSTQGNCMVFELQPTKYFFGNTMYFTKPQ